MTLDKSIASGKEKRKPYIKSRAFDRYCRNHGRCGHCLSNRTITTKKKLISVKEMESEG